ncbi:MAG: hypothetical protein KME31_08540 [Tolypothrix carrinoi HA7290-LM1]|jgi:hypothetical protein|nr:hypothetical protein [Tolypothrix carrinoi HA7290-LM1]
MPNAQRPMPNAQCPITKENLPLSKFIEILDKDGDPIIIDLEAVTHAVKTYVGVTVYFRDSYYVVLKEENADTLWEVLSEQSLKLYQRPQPDKK